MRFSAALLATLTVLQPGEAWAEAGTSNGGTPTSTQDASGTYGADCQLCEVGATGIEISIPLWLPVVGIEATSTEDEETQRIEFDPKLKFALVAEFRVRIGPIGVQLSANAASLGAQVVKSESGEQLGTVDLAAYVGHARFDWYIPPIRFSGGSRTELVAIWPYAGLRYALLSGSASGASDMLLLDGTKSWAEPLVGVEVLVDLRRGWLFRVASDVGGFGIGTDISIFAAAEARYAVTDWLNFRAAWKLYYARFSTSAGSGDVLLQGPGLGFGLQLF